MTNVPLRVLIVGCGNIAGGTGLPSLNGEALSHAAAYAADHRFKITACVDTKQTQATAFAQSWNVPLVYPTVEEALDGGETFDIASVCVPSDLHAQILWKLVESSVRLVLCEKPFTENLADAKKILTAFEEKGKPIAVAYTRLWHRGFRKISNELSDGSWGEIVSVHARYSRGILNTGSHIISMLRTLMGPLNVKYVGNTRHDFTRKDPTVDVILTNEEDIAIHLMGSDGRRFRFFEMEFITEQGAIRFEDWSTKVRRQRIIPYRYAPHIKTLGVGNWEDFGPGGSFEAMVDNLYQTITNKSALASDGLGAVETLSVIQQIIDFTSNSGNPK